MKEVIYNKDNIPKANINETITRVKILLINSKNEITLAFSDNVYHFIGGHVENGETLSQTLVRELKEETGIMIGQRKFTPFFKITQICKNYPAIGKNNCYEYYYYILKTDKLPNLNNTNYTQEEIKGNFELKKYNINKVENILKQTLSWSEKNKAIALTMLEALKEYKSLYKNN